MKWIDIESVMHAIAWLPAAIEMRQSHDENERTTKSQRSRFVNNVMRAILVSQESTKSAEGKAMLEPQTSATSIRVCAKCSTSLWNQV